MKHAAKYRLQSAIEKLLQHKKLDDITVSEIIETANVCRKTFYRNYQDRYALNTSYFAIFLITHLAGFSPESALTMRF